MEKNILANLVGSASTAFLSFAFVPFYIHFMGIESFGLVGFFITMQAVFLLLDMGLSATVSRELARLSVMPGSEQEMRNSVRTLELASVGADVVVASRKIENLQPVADQIASMGRRSLAVPTDVRESEQVDALMAKVEEDLGRIDILINNAGGAFVAAAEDISDRGWRAVVDLNLTGAFYCARAASKLMMTRQWGRIVNIVGTTPWTGGPGHLHASAAKGGLISATNTWALEWAKHNILVNGIAPGNVETEGVRTALMSEPGRHEKSMRRNPLGRFARPDEIGLATVFLCSAAADFITGETLVVDGGAWMYRPD